MISRSDALALLCSRSRFLPAAVALDPGLLDETLAGADLDEAKSIDRYRAEAAALAPERYGAALRRWRRRELLRIVLRETVSRDLQVAMAELSDLAAAAIDGALTAVAREMSPRFGPMPCPFSVIGMGKLGGRELNLSSDVDLIYTYEADRDANTHAWFRRFCQRLTRLLAEPTSEGFVYRVDLGLRPEGSTGPICNSLPATERYYEAWGHHWERVAWVRASPVAGDPALGRATVAMLEPFVYRRHLDLASLDAIRAIKEQIDRTAGAREDDVKLGPGGIREAEFFVQALQLVHGGRSPAVRDNNTIGALARLPPAGLLPAADAEALGQAYLHLRAVEHQIQLVDERQTHDLPGEAAQRRFVAQGLGFDELDAFQDELDRHRAVVTRLWSGLFYGGEQPTGADDPFTAIALGDLTPGRLEAAGFPADSRAAEHLRALRASPKSPLWPGNVRARQSGLVAELLAAVVASPDADQALTLLRELVRSMPARARIWRFLGAHPYRLRALVHLFGTSRFLGRLLTASPQLLGPVVLGGGLPARPAAGALARELALVDPEETESALIAVRLLHQRELLRIGFFDVAGELDVREVSAQLTTLAEDCIEAVTRIALRDVERRYGPVTGRLAIVAYGSLGAMEMSYGSDLDLMFLYEGDQRQWMRAVHRILNGLTLQMATGSLYAVDTRLRPSGNKGPLLVTPDALRRHHEGSAAIWEHQALLRARRVAGDPSLGLVLESLVETVLGAERDPAEVRRAVHAVRMRVLREVADEGPERADLKYGRGGLLELDLALQTLRLLDGGRALSGWSGSTESLLEALESTGFLSAAVAGDLREAYHGLRKLESRLRISWDRPDSRLDLTRAGLELLAKRMGYHDLSGRPGAVALSDDIARCRGAISTIYDTVMGLEGGV